MLFYVSTHGLSSLFLHLVFDSTLEVTDVASDPFTHLDLTSGSLPDIDSSSLTLVHSGSLLLSWIHLQSITGPPPVTFPRLRSDRPGLVYFRTSSRPSLVHTIVFLHQAILALVPTLSRLARAECYIRANLPRPSAGNDFCATGPLWSRPVSRLPVLRR